MNYLMIYLAINCILYVMAHDSIIEIKKAMGIPITVWPQFIIMFLLGIPLYIVAALRKK